MDDIQRNVSIYLSPIPFRGMDRFYSTAPPGMDTSLDCGLIHRGLRVCRCDLEMEAVGNVWVGRFSHRDLHHHIDKPRSYECNHFGFRCDHYWSFGSPGLESIGLD